MEGLHESIRRLQLDITNGMDDIARFISQQYMKKKIAEMKAKQEGGLKDRKLRDNKYDDEYLNSDLYESNQMIHDFGKISDTEKNFQSLTLQSGDNEHKNNPSHQPL